MHEKRVRTSGSTAGARSGGRARSVALAATGAGAALVFVAAQAPAAWLFGGLDYPASAIGYRTVDGTVWSWTLRDAAVNGVAVGDIHGEFSRRRILDGEIAYELTASGGALAGAGEVYRGFGGAAGIRNAAADIDLALFRRYRLLGQPLSGAARVHGASIDFADGACESASGEVWTDALNDTARSIGKGELELSGGFFCDSDRAALSLDGEAPGLGYVSVAISVAPARGYDLQVIARTEEEDVRDALEFSGFRENEDRLELKQSFAF